MMNNKTKNINNKEQPLDDVQQKSANQQGRQIKREKAFFVKFSGISYLGSFHVYLNAVIVKKHTNQRVWQWKRNERKVENLIDIGEMFRTLLDKRISWSSNWKIFDGQKFRNWGRMKQS